MGNFAALNSRQWVNEEGTQISVSGTDWWGATDTLSAAITEAMASASNADLARSILDLSNELQDDLMTAFDDPDETVFPAAVYDTLQQVNRASRDVEIHCEDLGVVVDFYHPLNEEGAGGSDDT